ncbi:MAG: serine--tRNA ligase, partial [Cyanobacteria bacterium P01_D01_bin.2]
MLDLKLIRQNPDQVAAALARRSGDYTQSLSELTRLDGEQRGLEGVRSQLQARSNEIGKAVGIKIKGGANPKGDEVKALREEGNQVKKDLAELEPQEKELKAKIQDILLTLPNLPSDSTPEGKTEDDNVEVRRWGDELIPQGSHFLPHYELGEKLGIMNFERSVKIAQSRFVTLIGAGAALERALIQFMLDRHTRAGYTEMLPPILVNSASLTGSGQLPKFAEDSFKCADDDLWLTPTAEVPLTNLHRSEILT